MTAPTRKPPVLIVIDAQELIYKRFIGKTRVLKVKAEAPLLPFEVELLRVQPETLLPMDPIPA
jgi:hypothetical protein